MVFSSWGRIGDAFRFPLRWTEDVCAEIPCDEGEGGMEEVEAHGAADRLLGKDFRGGNKTNGALGSVAVIVLSGSVEVLPSMEDAGWLLPEDFRGGNGKDASAGGLGIVVVIVLSGSLGEALYGKINKILLVSG